jgi:hypothetical protein
MSSSTSSTSNAVAFKLTRSDHWKEEETVMLIELMEKYKALLASVKRNNHIWEDIAREMRAHGFPRTSSQCRNRKKVLFRLFKVRTRFHALAVLLHPVSKILVTMVPKRLNFHCFFYLRVPQKFLIFIRNAN